MTPSAHGTAEPWGVGSYPDQDHPAHGAPAAGEDGREPAARAESREPPLTPSIEPARPEATPTARSIVGLCSIAALACAGLDLALTGGRLTFFFDLCFVVICLVAASAVRPSDLFTAGVLPPLLFAAVIAVLSVLAPHAFETGPGANMVFLTGLADHAAGLVFGYGTALLAVAARMSSLSTRRP